MISQASEAGPFTNYGAAFQEGGPGWNLSSVDGSSTHGTGHLWEGKEVGPLEQDLGG